MTRRAPRLDNNHAAIVAGIKERLPGAVVQSLAGVGKGVPDLLVGFMGVNILLEVKAPGGGITRLTPAEADWHIRWKGQACAVDSVDEAVEVILWAVRQSLHGRVTGA